MATAALSALVRQLRRRRPKGGQRSLRDISSELAARDHLNEGGCFLCGFDCLDASRAAASPHSRVKLLAILGISRPLSFATQPVRVPLKDFLFAPLVRRRRHVPVQAIELGCARTSRTNRIRQIGPRRIRNVRRPRSRSGSHGHRRPPRGAAQTSILFCALTTPAREEHRAGSCTIDVLVTASTSGCEPLL
jgi:hypothetical protein